MYQKHWGVGLFMLSILLLASGCVPQESPQVEQVQQTIPPNSPLAQIREGMGMAEVTSLIGPPTDQEMSISGKAFIPFYFGADRTVNRLHYKGLGRIYISGIGIGGGGGRVIKIEYDPQEPGFRQ